jgi:hypothetical protein
LRERPLIDPRWRFSAVRNNSAWVEPSRLPLTRKEDPMATTTIGQITIAYRHETHQFKTVSLAGHFLRQLRIKVGWFNTVKAAVNLMVSDKVMQIRHLKGDKFVIMKGLAQLEDEIKLSNA